MCLSYLLTLTSSISIIILINKAKLQTQYNNILYIGGNLY